jgi:hypothetical protein
MGVNGRRYAPATLYPGTYWLGGWVSLRADLDTEARGKILRLFRGSYPGRPVYNQTQH